MLRSKKLQLAIFFLLLNCYSKAQDVHFSLVTLPPELYTGVVLGVTQDPQGFLWLGTQSGLYKYDGHQITAYYSGQLNPNSLESSYIECVTAAKDGSIWVGHYSSAKGVERLDPSTGIFTHFHHSKNDNSSIGCDTVSAIMQDHEGAIWIGTNRGLDKYNSKTNTFTHFRHDADDPSSLSCDIVRAIYEDKDGTIWVGTGNAFEDPPNVGRLNKLNRQTGKFTRYIHDENDQHSLTDNRIRAIFEDSHKNFWVGTAGDGLHMMNRAKGTFQRFPYDPSHPEKLSRPPVKNVADHITFITEDNKGRIFIGTLLGGINVWDPVTKKVTYYGNDNKSKGLLKDEAFFTAYKSKEGVLWISTWGTNLYKVNPYEIKVPYTNLHTGFLNAFVEDANNNLWIGTNNGLVSRDSTEKIERILLDKNFWSYKNSITNIVKSDGNRFWLLTPAGLYLFNSLTHELKSYRHETGNINSLPCDTVLMVRKINDKNVWVATGDGLGMLNTATGSFKNYFNDPNDSTSISTNSIFTVEIGPGGNLWAGGTGLNRLDAHTGHFKRYLDQQIIICIKKDSEDNLWVTAMPGIVYKYDKEKDIFSPYIDETGVIKQGMYVYDIVEDHEKNLWMNTSSGVVKLHLKTGATILYGKNQGISTPFISPYGYLRNNGDVLYGDTSGYFTFNKKELNRNVPAPVVSITKFSLSNNVTGAANENISSFDTSGSISLKHNQNFFTFQFASLDFISSYEDTHLMYMLQNYDNTWHAANEERTAYYFNLPPGKYVFKVKASNGFGISAQKEITVIINPPWWSTWWAYCIYGVCFLTVALFANRIIRNRIIEKERMKSREKELAQAKEIEKAYHQLEKTHEELKATQTQLIQSEKMASLGELTAGIAHEIQNPLNFVNNFSEVSNEMIDEMKEKLQNDNKEDAIAIADDIKQNLEKINHHGKRADAIVKSMLQHSKQTRGVKEPTDINSLCDEYLRLAYQSIKAKDKDFNADIQTDFDESIGKINIIPQDIGRVLLNLYNNAFYATNEKLKACSLQHEANFKPTVSVQIKKLNNTVEIKVSDNGNGIPQNIIDKIFQPFFTTKPTGQGTGLGLSLSYDIIKAHGGEIRVETKVDEGNPDKFGKGEGTTFIIQLPV